MKESAAVLSNPHQSTYSASQLDVKEAIVERIAIKDEISKSASFNRGSLSKVTQGFRDIGDFILTKRSGNLSADDPITLHMMKEDLDLQLRLYEVEMKKLHRMNCATETEITSQQLFSESLSHTISQANTTFKELGETQRQELLKSRNIQEYEALASDCLALSSRRESNQKIKMCQDEINRLESLEAKYLADLSLREEKFQKLLNILSELKRDLDDNMIDEKPT